MLWPSQKAVVPVMLDGTAALFERNGHWIQSGKVTLRVLPPIDTEGLSRAEVKALPATTQHMIDEALQAVRDGESA